MDVRNLVLGCALVLLLTAPAAGISSHSDLADAVMNRNIKVVRSLLQHKADVNTPQADGSTALHWAAYWDYARTADLLIAAGASVRTVTREGVTPLALA